jgi:hypothetical protein
MAIKRGDVKTKVKGNLTTIAWKDKRNVHILTSMHSSPLECNFCDQHGKAMKLALIQDYNGHMKYVDKSDRMTNSYSINRRTCIWTKKLFFHLVDLNILPSCSSKLSHWQFRLTLERDVIQEAGKVLQPQPAGWKRQPHPQGIYKDLTKDTTDTGWCSVREFSVVCVPLKTKKQEQNTGVENAT